MKKDRNCSGSMNMPMAGYGVSMPIPMPPTPPMMGGVMYSTYSTPSYTTGGNSSSYVNTYNNVEQQLNNMQQQINMLDSRVSKLEGKPSSSITNKYSDSNYYML